MIKEVISIDEISGVNSPLLPRVASVFYFKINQDNVWCQKVNGELTAVLSSTSGNFTVILNKNADFTEIEEFLKFNFCCSVVSNLPIKNISKNTKQKILPILKISIDNLQKNMTVDSTFNLSNASFSSEYREIHSLLFAENSECFDNWFYDFSKKICKSKAKAVYKTVNEKIVSVAVSPSIFFDSAIISGVVTVEYYQKNGFSRECILNLLHSLKNDGVKYVYLWCENDLTVFYEKIGFKKISEVYITEF